MGLHAPTSSQLHFSLSMSFRSQPRFICNRCIQHLSRRNASSRVAPSEPDERKTRRDNGLTWQGMRFRKIKLDIEDKKFDAANLLLGKAPRLVREGPVQQRILHVHTNAPHVHIAAPAEEVRRPMGRTRFNRARVPRPMAAKLLELDDPPTPELVPSEPSDMLDRVRKDALNEESMPSEPYTILGEVKNTDANPGNSSNVTIRPGLGLHDNFHLYWETLRPSYGDRHAANNFFLKGRHPHKLLMSAAHFREVPESDVPEVAFVGRSNVGKSSLLNAVVGANMNNLLARTSATRGFTKTMNFYGIGSGAGVLMKREQSGRQKFIGTGVALVDMPGYGDGSLAAWGVEIMKYIQNRKQLRRVFVLLDAEHGIKDKDRSLLATLRLAGVSHQIILSKMDKIYVPDSKKVVRHIGVKRVPLKRKGMVEALHAKMEEMRPDIQPPVGGGAVGEIIACSSEAFMDGRRLGLDHVRYAILKAAGLEDVKHKHKSRKQ